MSAAQTIQRPPEEIGPGVTFAGYHVARKIGEGSMAAVFEAQRVTDGARVALKVLHPHVASQPEVRARFAREGRTAARVRHPHVAAVLDAGERDGVLYLALEYLEGETLGARLARERRLDAKVLAEVMLPVCAALGAVHAAKIVHRDLKPDNVFLARNARGGIEPRLLDFGISKAPRSVDSQLTMAHTTLGTAHYMSPEQTRGGRDLDARSDQFALGVILYECATGAMPFDGPNTFAVMRAILDGAFAPPRNRRPDLPEAFEALILRALAPAPDARFSDVVALGRALYPFAGPAAQDHWRPVFGGERLSRSSAPDVSLEEGPFAEITLSEGLLAAEVADLGPGATSLFDSSIPPERPDSAVRAKPQPEPEARPEAPSELTTKLPTVLARGGRPWAWAMVLLAALVAAAVAWR